MQVEDLRGVAGELECTLSQLALAWCLKNPNVSTVITGASKVSQIRENVGALDVVDRLDDFQMKRIEHILDNKPSEETDPRGRDGSPRKQ